MNYTMCITAFVGCVGIGAYIWRLRELSYFSWAPVLFLVLAAVQVIALPIGVIAGRLKSQPMLLFYILLATIVTCGLGSTGITSFLFAGIVTGSLSPTISEKDYLACSGDYTGCCCCDNSTINDAFNNRCPEWSTNDVVALLQMDLKITGVVALVCMAYLVGSLTVAGLLNTDLKNYKTDYV